MTIDFISPTHQSARGIAMDQMVNDRSRAQQHLQRIAAALGAGIVLLDSNREIAWMDRRTRTRLNGGMEKLASSLRMLYTPDAISCSLTTQEVMINGESTIVCLIWENKAQQDEQGNDAIAAVEAALADTSWFKRTIIERLKALRHTKPPAPRMSDLDILTDRERDVLSLICEGRSDAEMSALLKLSHNTVRNHIASLYRKIGVNRRSAAIIWARERAITPQDVLPQKRRLRPNRPQA
jgi:DNA-binding NarL/FixJ family response regulator